MRVTIQKSFGVVLGFSLAFASSAGAQSVSLDLGEFEYMNSCAVCHGNEGDGKGPLADMLNVAPPDLTQLQQNNGGVFPVSAAFAIIEGSADVGAHGTRQMPAWGRRYQERAAEDQDFSPLEKENYPTIRILALIEYLSNIQK